MYALIALGVTSFILCFLLTPLFRDLFTKLKLVDMPDHRKLHPSPIPRIGGLPIAISYVAALGVLMLLSPKRATIFIQHPVLFWGLLPAAGIIFLTGFIDDLLTLKPWQKLAGQVVAASIAVLAGARITWLHGQPHSEWITFPLSVLWLLGCTNAFNLIDGMDGLASGVGFFATATMLLAALFQGNLGLAMATVPLAGCLLAFLRYNFNPASIFLGDSGSLTIGFSLGCFGVIWSQKSATAFGMLAPMMALALPLFDVGISIVRRFLRGQPIFQADRGHIHHRLLALGLHPRNAALVLYAVCFIAAMLSLMQSSMSFHLGGPIIIVFCLLAWMGIKRLKYIEFATAGRVLASGGLFELVKDEIRLEHFKETLTRAGTPSECWEVIREASREMEFSSVELTVNGYYFEDVFQPPASSSLCTYSVFFEPAGHITLTGCLETTSSSLPGSFFEILKECMSTKDYHSWTDSNPPFRSNIEPAHRTEKATAG